MSPLDAVATKVLKATFSSDTDTNTGTGTVSAADMFRKDRSDD